MKRFLHSLSTVWFFGRCPVRATVRRDMPLLHKSTQLFEFREISQGCFAGMLAWTFAGIFGEAVFRYYYRGVQRNGFLCDLRTLHPERDCIGDSNARCARNRSSARCVCTPRSERGKRTDRLKNEKSGLCASTSRSEGGAVCMPRKNGIFAVHHGKTEEGA